MSTPHPPDPLSPALRKALVDNHIVPLWESQFAHGKEVAGPDTGYLWAWALMRPILMAVGEVTTPAAVERRVLSLIDPRTNYADGEATTGTLNATLQLLLPGNRARPHRHTIDALRFVLEAQGGAKTIVDGKSCPMERGDLVLTPGWCWHEHVHEGEGPVMWLDVLNVALHRFMGTEVFQPGPVQDAAPQWDDALFATPNIVPVIDWSARPYAPVFRFPWADAVRAVRAAPLGPDGARTVRYTNPMDGGPSLALMDSLLTQLDAGSQTRTSRSSASTVCCVVEGHGSTQVAGHTHHWAPNDVFTLPANSWASHQATPGSGPARLFKVSNGPLFKRLGLFTQAYGD